MTDATKPKISVQNVWKSFRLPHQRETTMKSRVINLVRAQHVVEKRLVLKDVSFEIYEGEFVGIIGRNGSGKSTLLKLLAGIYYADQGHIGVNGEVTPFIELGVGFSPELTGRENVFLNGSLLGFDHKEVEAMYDEIVTFAELEQFMDLQLKNYSSGMQVRLAFAIAVKADPDILLIDEVLAVGDAAFQQKCFNYFYELKQKKQTIVFVSHEMESVQRYCDRVVYIDQGVIRHQGNTAEVVSSYLQDVFERSPYGGDQASAGSAASSSPAKLLQCTLSPNEVESTGELTLVFTYEILRPTQVELRFGIVKDGSEIAQVTTQGTLLDHRPGRYTADFTMRLHPFLRGKHVVSGGIFHAGDGEPFDVHQSLADFYVRDTDIARSGIMRIDGQWTSLSSEAR